MLQFWQAVRASYWFVPSIMVVLAIGLGAFVIWLDSGPLATLFDDVSWYQKSKPAGAREVLSAIAGSAITVAGVAFSITIVAISFAANQYGPRILTNFMSDRGNQFTLGTFIATFVYCLMVLRTIYSGDSDFVPQLAIITALLLALCSTGMLIYFIHHVPQSIHVNTVLAGIGKQLTEGIKNRFPSCLGDPPEQSDRDRERFEQIARSHFGKGAGWCGIDSDKNGYLQAVDDERIFSVACEHDLKIRMECAPGEFLFDGQLIFRVSPAHRVDDEVKESLHKAWTVGSSRTPTQDQMFLIDELIEIAARALSSGVNDPYTAVTCLDWLSASAAELARRRSPSPFRLDDQGELRVVAPADDFRRHVERGFGRLRSYAATDVNAALHMLRQLRILSRECRTADHVEVLAEQAEALLDLSGRALEGVSLEAVREAGIETRAALTDRVSELAGDGVEKIATRAVRNS